MKRKNGTMATTAGKFGINVTDVAENNWAIFEQARVGMVCADLEVRLVQANQKYCEIVGRSEQELRTLRIRDITHPDDAENKTRLRKLVVRGDLTGRRKYSRRADVSNSARILETPD
jgi:PAS domain S-box-containing protein